MQKFLSTISAYTALALSISSTALASGDYCYVPMSQWQSRSAAILWAEAQGWQVHRVKIDDGCYELYGMDESGEEFEVKLNPATLEVLVFEYEPHGYRNRIFATDPTVHISDIELEN